MPAPPARRAVPYVAATALAMTAVLVPFQWLESPGASSRIATVPVVVAATDLPEGVTVDRMAVLTAQWPASTRPAGAYGSVDSVAGRMTRVPVYKGEAIVPGRLAPEGTVSPLQPRITPGKRAYGIRINDAANMAGMIMPNARVDIMVVIDDRRQNKRVAKLFLENMRVLAIGAPPRRAQNGDSMSAVVSIEVTPEQAERLAIAAAQGTLHLVLRGYGDPDSIEVGDRGAPIHDLLNRRPRSPTAAAPQRKSVSPVRPDTVRVKVFRGPSSRKPSGSHP